MSTDTLSELPRSRKEAIAKGLKHFFTGRPCLRGHLAKRTVRKGECLECQLSKLKHLGERHEKANIDHRKKWAERNKSKRARSYRDYRLRNKDKVRTRQAVYRTKNKERLATHARSRRAIARGATGSHTVVDILGLLCKQRHRCFNCLCKLADGYHVDHRVPLSKGGSNDVANLQILCEKCNCSKHNKDPLDWARENGRLL